MRKAMDELSGKMAESRQQMVIWLFLLMLLPGLMVSMIQQNRADSKTMAKLFDKVLMRVRESNAWWEYWKDRRETFKVINDDLSWKEIMKVERSKEREELGKVPGGLFAKWTTDRKAFDEDFLEVHLVRGQGNTTGQSHFSKCARCNERRHHNSKKLFHSKC